MVSNPNLFPTLSGMFFSHTQFSTFAIHLVLLKTSQFLNVLSKTFQDTGNLSSVFSSETEVCLWHGFQE